MCIHVTGRGPYDAAKMRPDAGDTPGELTPLLCFRRTGRHGPEELTTLSLPLDTSSPQPLHLGQP